ncbi:MAG: hypothetical protein QOG49_988 [Frankiaceae bacterium]|jgi:hypothetical protein|nr:hypothetical protein [Frankiaceae bacterium]
MGRGRAKAKQTKVARELKYSSGGTDLDRLRAELTSPTGAVVTQPTSPEDEDDDEIDDLADLDDEDAD